MSMPFSRIRSRRMLWPTYPRSPVMIRSYSCASRPKSSRLQAMVSAAAGAMQAPIFWESLRPKSTIFPTVTPAIRTGPGLPPTRKAALPVTVHWADRGRWLA